jgi:hypothetical protein
MTLGELEKMENLKETSLVRQTYTKNSLVLEIPLEDRVARAAQEFVIRRLEDSGQRLDIKPLNIRSASYESHMTSMGIHPDMYPIVYEKAVQLYNPDKSVSPFGIDYVIRAAKLLSQPPRKEIRINKQVYICTQCKDTGFELNGLLPKTVEIEGKKEKVKCEACR